MRYHRQSVQGSLLPLFIVIGTVFGALAAAAAYTIAYDGYRRQRLRPGQSAKQMALTTAIVTFVFFFVGAIVLSFVLKRG